VISNIILYYCVSFGQLMQVSYLPDEPILLEVLGKFGVNKIKF